VHDKPRQMEHVQQLVWRLDDYKLTLQLGMDVGMFAHTAQGSSDHSLGFHPFAIDKALP